MADAPHRAAQRLDERTTAWSASQEAAELYRRHARRLPPRLGQGGRRWAPITPSSEVPRAPSWPDAYEAAIGHPRQCAGAAEAGGRSQRDGGDEVEPVSLTIGGIVAALVL